MAKGKVHLGTVELEVLQFVAERPASSVGEAAAHFASLGKARTTVATVMERLREKGFLARRRVRGVYRYAAKQSMPLLARNYLDDLVKKTLGGSVAPLVAYLTKSENLTPDDVARLRRIVDRLEGEL